MTNGIIDINAGGIKHRLRFGRLAYEHFMTRPGRDKSTSSKLTIDLVHSGMINYADSMDEPFPERIQAVDLCEAIWDGDDSVSVMDKVWDTFFESRDGKKVAVLSKKKTEADQPDGGEGITSGAQAEHGVVG